MSKEYEIECGDRIDIKFERATGISGLVMATQPLTIKTFYCDNPYETVIIGSYQTVSIKEKQYTKKEKTNG